MVELLRGNRLPIAADRKSRKTELIKTIYLGVLDLKYSKYSVVRTRNNFYICTLKRTLQITL